MKIDTLPKQDDIAEFTTDVKRSGSSTRSDTDVARSAENVLHWARYVPKDSVKVKVESGGITLSGEVDWEYQRMAAADAVRRLMGATGVGNHIAIRPKLAEIHLAMLDSLDYDAFADRKRDNQLKQDVIADLTFEPSVHAAQAGVEVKVSRMTTTAITRKA